LTFDCHIRTDTGKKLSPAVPACKKLGCHIEACFCGYCERHKSKPAVAGSTARALLDCGGLKTRKPGMTPSSEGTAMSTDREEVAANARAKHLRKHPKEAEPGVVEKVQEVAGKAADAAKAAAKKVIDAVTPAKSS
jgi:hypothetical protein